MTQGALFHHFATRRDLVVAAMERYVERSKKNYEQLGVSALEGDLTDLVTNLLAMSRSVPPALWIEVLVATRTDDEFLAALTEALDRSFTAARSVLEHHPALAAMSPVARETWHDLIGSFYMGEALWTMGGGFDDLDADTVAALAGLADHLTNRAA